MIELPLAAAPNNKSEEPELDVRAIPHALRHAAIHGVINSLKPGFAFVLVAPHDPIPLLKEIAEYYGSGIKVEYVQEGPTAWKLRLGRA